MKVLYVETSVASFYCETRQTPDVIARRDWTREWWETPDPDQIRVTSEVTFEELGRIPDTARREQALDLLSAVRLLDYTLEVAEIVEVYLAHKLMPREALGDADHLALASFYRCDMLITWNCRHLANANKTDHIRRVNALLGLPSPLLVTPLELLETNLGNDS